MFTGIVAAVGRVVSSEPLVNGERLVIEAGTLPLDDVAIGDSIAVAGVCLTVTALADGRFAVEVSRETLDCTAGFAVGARVNLEQAMRPMDRLGGHLVSGHVDGIGEVLHFAPDGTSWRLEVAAPASLARYIARKGSVTIDGVSLTVNEVDGIRFGVNLIPHTLQVTTLEGLRPGSHVNLEIDLIARYVERLMQDGAGAPS